MTVLVPTIARLGAKTREAIVLCGTLSYLFRSIVWKSFFLMPRINLRLIGRQFFTQIWFTGIQSLPIIMVLGALIGTITILGTFSLLEVLAEDLIGGIIVGAVVREFAPLVTGVVLIVRSGTAIATELGSMRLNGEIDVLRAHRIDPISFLVLPRVYGVIVSLFSLAILFDVSAFFGGWAGANLLTDLPYPVLYAKVQGALTNEDFFLHLLKSVSFGMATGMLACYFGLKVRKSPTELPRAVSKAAVASLVSIFCIDGVIVLASLFL